MRWSHQYSARIRTSSTTVCKCRLAEHYRS